MVGIPPIKMVMNGGWCKWQPGVWCWKMRPGGATGMRGSFRSRESTSSLDGSYTASQDDMIAISGYMHYKCLFFLVRGRSAENLGIPTSCPPNMRNDMRILVQQNLFWFHDHRLGDPPAMEDCFHQFISINHWDIEWPSFNETHEHIETHHFLRTKSNRWTERQNSR